MTSSEHIQSGLRLRIVEGTYEEALHPLTRPSVSIGRSTPETPYSESYLTFPEPTLSRLHALLSWQAESKTYVVHHKSQTNPTLLNGRQLIDSEILKAGDILALGRLVAILEVDHTRQIKTVPLVPQETQFTLNFTSEQNTKVLSIPLVSARVDLNFTNDPEIVDIVLGQQSQEIQSISIPANTSSLLSISIDLDSGSSIVEAPQTEVCEAAKVIKLPCGTLSVPLVNGQAQSLSKREAVLHQGYYIWLDEKPSAVSEASPAESRPSELGWELNQDSKGAQLHFLNGIWGGATLNFSTRDSVACELGSGPRSLSPDASFYNSPSCQISVKQDVAQLRVSQVTDEQIVDVDGQVLLVGEVVPLHSGSQILLGDCRFQWLVPALHAEYSRFQIAAPDGIHRIDQAEVRLGTAPHCEVRLQIEALAPVVGRLIYEKSKFSYEHNNIALPAKVDGIETSAGLKAPVYPGSKLELAPGVIVCIQEIN